MDEQFFDIDLTLVGRVAETSPSVPEPDSLLLLLLAGAGLAALRGYRRPTA